MSGLLQTTRNSIEKSGYQTISRFYDYVHAQET